jgi:hypothetical protein
MKNFFLFLTLWVVSVLSFDFVLSRIFDKVYKEIKTGQTGGEVNRFLSMNKVPSVLLMGNSRARYQVNPDSFALVTYSLCHAGMGQVFQTGLLHILMQEKKVPRIVILHVDLAEYIADDNLEDVGNLRYYYGKNPYINSKIDKISRFEKVKYIFGFYRYNGRIISTLKNFIQSRGKLPKTNGYQPLAPTVSDSTTFLEHHYTNLNKKPRFHYQNLRHLQDFIALCKQSNVKLLCFTSPYFSSRTFASVAARPIDSLLNAQHIPYFNAAAHPLPVLKHHALFWKDIDHLNRMGAGYLSHQLGQWSNPFLLNKKLMLPLN